MVLSTVINGIDLVDGHDNDIGSPVKLSSPQFYSCLESEDEGTALQLPSISRKKPLGNDAKDLMNSDSDQQQHQQHQTLLNSSSDSSCSFDEALVKMNLIPSHQIRHVKEPFEASPSARSSRSRGNPLEKAAKLREALNIGSQTSETSGNLSKSLLNHSGALCSSSNMSSTSQIFAHQNAAPGPVILPLPRSSHARNPTSSTTIIDGVYNQPSSHGRLYNDSQHPRPKLPNDYAYLSSTIVGHRHGAQNNWAIGEYLFIKVSDLPDNITTQDLWEAFKHEGHIAHIRLHENDKGYRDGGASVKFSPQPATAFWERGRYPIQLAGGRKILVKVYAEPRRSIVAIHSQSKYPETMAMYAESVDFGIMVNQTTMMNMRTVLSEGKPGIRFSMNVFHKEISVEFPMHIVDPRATFSGPNTQMGKYDRTELFQFRIPFTQLKVIHQKAAQEDTMILLISTETPPKFFKQLDPSKSHDDKSVTWGDNDAWYRQTDLVYFPNRLKKSPLTWRKKNPIIDLGRWTTYRLTFNSPRSILPQFNQMREALRDYNIEIVPFPKFQIIPRDEPPLWKLIDPQFKKLSSTGTGLEEMIYANKPHMPFEVHYQLEVCLSQGFLNEHNLSEEFIWTLLNMNTKQAQDLLEYIANHGNRAYDPMLLIQAINGQGLLSRTKIPSYCAYVRSATVTPTTVYFQTPAAETSNRVIRQYSQYADRFLRVRFTEEKTEGKIYTMNKGTMNEVFTRVKRVLNNGIKIGDRTYEFLACGNSQFREHGAYFFAPLPNLRTEKIRKWMGMFEEIKTVALYASRLGQCFSTTRAIHGARATTVEIPDIRRNGYNFTDGVGRISPFLAYLAASELGILQHSQDPPSVFQIRVGGCKGVLAISPDSVGREIHIRKSQYKFPAVDEVLEIIRWSQYAAANLNRQIILILSALGVQDQVFAQKLQTQLSRLERAMTDEAMALAILQKEIDHNQMTLTVASMILDGFQSTGEPFLTSLLHLWRAWSIKYLKEKARITIGAGALLLGCVDETAILQGHFNDTPTPSADATNDEKAKSVPQVFVQISKKPDGQSEVILGPMLLARNPSLHPGDVRVVCGVDVPQLHHLKDVVVLPQTGDRDVAGMCSGGDLDGDDFLVIWDQDLLPNEWNHEPMDYSRPPMEQPKEKIGIDDLTTFFVTFMKNDALPVIAQAHTANADYLEEGVRDAKCLKLASLHSMAVDYVKTGQPAHLSRDLRPLKWPHFMEKVGKQQHKIYTSKKVLGQLYDQVERIDFIPAFAAPFDTRILQAYTLGESILESARDIKEEYDAHMRRIMAQQEIKTEFEVWSTFVLQHTSTSNAFKYHEQIGEISMALKDQFRLICHERAGGKDYEHMGPFVAAMYEVTAREVTAAVDECHRVQMIGGQWKPLREMTPSTMPLMSFPWLFQDILGKIAKKNSGKSDGTLSIRGQIGSTNSVQLEGIMAPQPKRGRVGPSTLDPGDSLKTSNGITRPGELLELFGKSTESYERKGHADAGYIPSSSISINSSNSSVGTSLEHHFLANDGLTENSSSSSPELLARMNYDHCSHKNDAPVKSTLKSTARSQSSLRRSKDLLVSQGSSVAVWPGVTEKPTALDEAIADRVSADDDKIPNGSNLRLLNNPIMGLSVRSDESRDLELNSYYNTEESALEDVCLAEAKAAKTSQLPKAHMSDYVDKDADTETTKRREKHKSNEEVDYSSNSDTELDEVVLYNDNQIGLLDQLAAIAGDDCTLERQK